MRAKATLGLMESDSRRKIPCVTRSDNDTGYTIANSPRLMDAANEILWGLSRSLGLMDYSQSPQLSNKLLAALQQTYESDRDQYFGLLRAVALMPSSLALPHTSEIIEAAISLGIEVPALVTPPILHIVAPSLMATQEKVITPWHQDMWSTRGSSNQVVVWIPLHDVDQDNYPLEVLPQSHLAGLRPTHTTEFGLAVEATKEEEIASKAVELKKGECCVFSSYLVHRTSQIGVFRMAVSFRLNDLLSHEWAHRKFFNPFTRHIDSTDYRDGRQLPMNKPGSG
jgi:phytanoyl-CoA hydroxylase